MQRLSAALLALTLLACGSIRLQEVQDIDTLYFGTARPGGAVSHAEWHQFVEEVVTPQFPGFTEWDAMGHWQGSEELTHVIQIAHLSRRGNDEAINRVISEYKKRFQQQSVLWIRGRGLVNGE